MARKLQLDIDGDSRDAARALDSVADNVDELRRSTGRLQHEFNQAERAAGGLSNQTKQLGDRFIYAVGAAGKVGREIDNIGDQARQSARAVDELGDQLSQLGRRGGGVQGVTRAAAELGVKAGTEAASTFTSLFQGGVIAALKNLPAPAQAGLAASLGAAIVLATPVIASAINAAIITGVGAGGLAAGIAIAARAPGVQAAFAELGTEAMKGLTEAASPFEDQLKQVAQIFRDGLADVLPDLKGIFGDLATTVQPLARGLLAMAKEALPGIRRAAAAAVPLLEALADELPDLGRALNAFFDEIAEGGPGAIAFMSVFLDQVEAGIVGLGAWLGEMGKVLGGAAILADAMGLVNFDPSIVSGKIGEVGGSVATLKGAFSEANREIKTFKERLDDAFGVSMDAVEANLALKESLARLKETLAENKGKWDDNTAAGRANIEALKDSIQKAHDKMEADIAAGVSASAAREEFRKTTQGLIDQARAAGASASVIGQLTGAWINLLNMPSTKDLTVRVHQIGSVSAQGVVSGGDPRRNAGRAYASGGRYEAGVPRKVGENGWEIDVPDHGGYVINHADAMRMMNSSRSPIGTGQGGGGTRTLQPVVLQIGPYQIAKALIEYADTRGVTVARLLGIS